MSTTAGFAQSGDLAGQTALVTGATSGIGRAIARQLARHGANADGGRTAV